MSRLTAKSPWLGDWGFIRPWLSSLVDPSRAPHKLSPSQLRAARILGYGTLALAVALFLACWLFWKVEGLRFWLQTFTGNWSPENSDAVGGFWFSVSVVIGVMLNWLPLVAAVTFFVKFVRPLLTQNRNLAMNVSQALSVRTATEISLVINSLVDYPEAAKRAQAAFDQANTEWRTTLINTLGPERAGQVFKLLNQEID